MKIKQTNDNGNLTVLNRSNQQGTINQSRFFDNNTWLITNNQTNGYNTSNLQFHSNSNLYVSGESESFGSDLLTAKIDEVNVICNRQYRINSLNDTKINDTDSVFDSTTALISRTQGDINAFTDSTILNEDESFANLDINVMSEKGLQHMPRGIVNPNYPGFQHLAHTLQDYPSNIENFYYSENEMTDDDVDLDITESSNESEPKHDSDLITATICNNNNEESIQTSLLPSQKGTLLTNSTLDSIISQIEVPDLLKTVTNNNNNIQTIDFGCSDNDIENNFQKEDIIGDFNKEIEDEIKLLLNYNISIHDDLEELRKDIKDTFTEPIENTINNINDVVIHVIKKLVETQAELPGNENVDVMDCQTVQDCLETIVMNKENERNTRTEINLSRPTFLLIEDNINNKIADAFLSDGKDEINIYDADYDTTNLSRNVENTIKQLSTELRKIIPKLEEMREFDKLWSQKKTNTTSIEKDGNSNEILKATKTNILNSYKNNSNDGTLLSNNSTETTSPKTQQRNRPVPVKSSFCTSQSNSSVHKNEVSKDDEIGSFDVYNIETALPKIDLDAIENHLKAAKEAARRKRNDREEIRKRLAMGIENDEYYSLGYPDRPGKKPSLHSRLQNASDNESQSSDIERSGNKSLSQSSIFSSKSSLNHPYQTRPLSVSITKNDKISTVQSSAKLRPSSLSLKSKLRSSQSLGHIELKESDFYALQATLQTEARMALAQAKELARIQMERERRCRSVSPVTEMLRHSMQKANAPLAPDRRRVSRQLLTDMNIAQLQVIVNELHSQIESLNDSLVKLLMGRDELHMGQDSMLVDIEDLTRYLGVKEQAKKTKGTSKSGVRRLASLVHK